MVVFRLGIVVAVGALLLAFAPPERPVPVAPYAEGTAASDTLRLAVRAGETLIAALPVAPGATYRAVDPPALSWLVGRSFMWRTLDRERGALDVHVVRERPGAARDTLVLRVEIVA